MTCIKRREFITLLGGVAAWPLVARAQQPDRMRRVGVLLPFTADDQEGQARLMAFAQHLQQLGWTVGTNLRIDARWGAGDAERIRKYAAELLALTPDVIVANGGPEVSALRQTTRTVPIVFANAADPVGQVSSRACRGRGALLPVLPRSTSLVRAENGLSCSKRLRLR